MVLEIIGILCCCYTGYSGFQIIKAPFSYFSRSTQMIDTSVPMALPIRTAYSGGPASNINTNQNSAGLFAVNYSDGNASSLLGYVPIVLCSSIGVGYVVKTKILQGTQLLHNSTSWSYWLLKNVKKDHDLLDAFEKELAHRCTNDEEKNIVRARIRKQIDDELNCLHWLCRITSITKKVYLAWFFDIQEEDILLAHQAITDLNSLRTLLTC